MAHQSGSLNLASDFNAMLAGLRTVAGVGTGDRGYGLDVPADIAVGTLATSELFTNFRNLVFATASHQGVAFTGLKPASELDVGDRLSAFGSITLPGSPVVPSTSQFVVEFPQSGRVSWTVPVGCVAIDLIECWGAGAAGGEHGGGGGAYSSITNLAFANGQTFSGFVGKGGLVSASGGNTWFNTTTTVFAEGGQFGSSSGGIGGRAALGYGSTKFSGGNGGNSYSRGGGAAASPLGHGNTATTSAGASSSGGGVGGTSNSSGQNHPLGGGGGGASNASTLPVAPHGGHPGGGGGSQSSVFTNFGGPGADGKIRITYSMPAVASGRTNTVEIHPAFEAVYQTAADTISWTVPSNCISIDLVECWGPGSTGAAYAQGGGGGAYAASSSISFEPGQTFALTLGRTADTAFGSNIVMAKAASGATGGQATASIGATKFSGGSRTTGDAGGASASPSGGGGAPSGTSGGSSPSAGSGGSASTTGQSHVNGGGGGGRNSNSSTGDGGYPGGGAGYDATNTWGSGRPGFGKIRITYTTAWPNSPDVVQPIESFIAGLDETRGSAAVQSMVLAAAAHTVTRATTWGTSGTPSISAAVDVVFASEDAARWFFNSGGEIRLRPTHPSGTGTQNTNWRTNVFTNAIGTLIFKRASVAVTGTATSAVASSLGFYALTTSPQTIFNGQNIGTGAYSSNDVTVTAHVLNRTGTRGGNGTTIRFTITLNDQHSGPSDTVAAGTAVTFDTYRAAGLGIAQPTFSTVSGF